MVTSILHSDAEDILGFSNTASNIDVILMN